MSSFLTPAPVADQAASLFTPIHQPVRILDLGSGTGILSVAVAELSADGSSVVAVEQDTNLADDSERTLSQVCHNTKVINASVLETLLDPVFDCVILNPPYKKISPAGSSERRNTLDSEGIVTWCSSSTGPSTGSCGDMQAARRAKYLDLARGGMNFTQAAHAVGVSKRTEKAWRNGRTRSTGRNERPLSDRCRGGMD